MRMVGRIAPRRCEFPALEWIEEASGALPRLILAGGRRAMIENLTGIIEFTEQRIRLNTKSGILTITGRDMILTQVRPDAMTLRGCISQIELPDYGDA